MLSIIQPLILFLVIMDPLVGISALLSMGKGKTENELRKIAVKSVIVASLVFFTFAFFGSLALQLLGVTLDSFRAAAGIILILLGLQFALGLSFPRKNEEISEVAVVIGTPLISGPATISATIVLVSDTGLFTTLFAGTIALAMVLAALLFATRISRIIGRAGMQVLTTMMGLVTIAWGLQFLVQGLGF